MKKLVLTAFFCIVFAFFAGCDEESDPPRVFDNGITVLIGDRDCTARNDVECKVTTSASGYQLIEFRAKTAKDEEWLIKFRLNDPEDKIVKISENYNEIRFSSTEIGDHLIKYDSDRADETVIEILKFEEGKIIEAIFSGFIQKTGGSAEPDSLNKGYMITKKFATSK